jgi:hypothetical protein
MSLNVSLVLLFRHAGHNDYNGSSGATLPMGLHHAATVTASS